MALLSLKRLGEAPSTEINQRILAQLVEMVTLQPVAADPEECERFIAQVHRIQDEVAADASTDQILAAVRAIGGALATHQEVVSNLFRHQGSELQNMVCRQTDTLNSMMRMASNVSARNLESIAMQLKDACALDDIQVLRIRLRIASKVCAMKRKGRIPRSSPTWESCSASSRTQNKGHRVTESRRRLIG